MNLSVSLTLDSRSPFGTFVPPPPAGGGGIERSEDDGEVVQSSTCVLRSL